MSLEIITTIGGVIMMIVLCTIYTLLYVIFGYGFVESTGCLTLFYFVVEVGKIIIIYTSTETLSPTYPNEWAIVTGCTNGLGKSLSIDLAKQGFNLVLISRTKSSLEKLSNEIEILYRIKTIVIEHDFEDVDFDTIKNKLEVIADLTIGVIINNVGISEDSTERFGNYPQTIDNKIIDINIKAQEIMTKILLPTFEKQQYGYVINISSGSAYQPSPFIATYGASKVFLKNWSNALGQEYKNSGIKFYVCMPLFFISNMVKEKESFLVPKSNVISLAILRHCLLTNESCPYFPHWIQNFVLMYTPIPSFNYRILEQIHLKKNKEN